MVEGGEVSVAKAEVESKKTTKIKHAIEQGSASNETSQAYESERYQRGDLIIEKRFSVAEKDLWPLRSIDLTVSQNGQKLRMNDLLPEGWTIVEDLFGTEPYFHSGKNRIVLPHKVFMPVQAKEVHGLEKIESSRPSLTGEEENGKLPEAHDFFALRGSLMALLHEIGHIDDLSQLTEEERTHDKAIRTRLNEEHKLEVSVNELNDTDLQDYVDTIYHSERGAWMQAFKRYRQIKKETGIDLAEGRSATKVIESGRACLTSYEGNDNLVLSTYRNTIRI
jgi:hypothetical protein